MRDRIYAPLSADVPLFTTAGLFCEQTTRTIVTGYSRLGVAPSYIGVDRPGL